LGLKQQIGLVEKAFSIADIVARGQNVDSVWQASFSVCPTIDIRKPQYNEHQPGAGAQEHAGEVDLRRHAGGRSERTGTGSYDVEQAGCPVQPGCPSGATYDISRIVVVLSAIIIRRPYYYGGLLFLPVMFLFSQRLISEIPRSADRRETLPHDRKLVLFYNPTSKMTGALPKKLGGQKHANFGRFYTTSDFDREYLRDGLRYQKSES